MSCPGRQPGDVPLRIVHAVCTDAFAGVERSIVLSSRALAARGHEIHVVGGDDRMPERLGDSVRSWRTGASVASAVLALRSLGPVDVIHAHMTAAELAATLSGRWRGAHLVTTRHFAAVRGSSAAGRVLRPLLARVPHTELAISPFVADAMECPSTLVPHGLEAVPQIDGRTRSVVVIQRLEAEKDTATALRAWGRSSLPQRGWTLTVAGDGAQRVELEQLTASLGIADSVTFVGHVADPGLLRARAAIQFASAPAEPFGLSVLEAMACGLPVVAAAGGAHPYLLGTEAACLFTPGDVDAAAARLDALADDEDARLTLAGRLRRRAGEEFSLERHGELLEAAYRSRSSMPAPAAGASEGRADDLLLSEPR